MTTFSTTCLVACYIISIMNARLVMHQNSVVFTQSFKDFFSLSLYIYNADLPQEVDMYHELVPLEPQHNVNKSTIFGYATSVYKVCLRM